MFNLEKTFIFFEEFLGCYIINFRLYLNNTESAFLYNSFIYCPKKCTTNKIALFIAFI